MKESIQKLIGSLRHELEQYGEMLARLDHQQETVLRRDSAAVLDGAAAIENQASVIETARSRREAARAELAVQCGLASDSAFAEILPCLPGEYRPLIQALVDENNQLLDRVRNRSRQNHLLLTRTVDLMQRLLGNLFSVKAAPTYGGDGALLVAGAPARSLYEAVG